MEKFAKLANWNYGAAPQFPYGEETSYRKAIEFLDGPYTIEDWGCGTAWAKRFVKRARYIGIDGSWSFHCDLIADLRTYRSKVDGVMMRHLLEHSYNWKAIIENAIASFEKRFCVIFFTPFSDTTHVMAKSKVGDESDVPDISFRKDDILDYLKPFSMREEFIKTQTQYGQETLFYMERK